MRNYLVLAAAAAAALFPSVALAAESGGHSGHFPLVFLFVVVMLLIARLGAMVERIKQPAVLGELLGGVLLGALAFLPGLGVIDGLRSESFIRDLAEVGVILLLFKTGLESNVAEMAKVGARALTVAVIGVVLPFAGGFLLSKSLLPDFGFNTYLFIGATLTATSVGITARVFKDLGVLKTPEAKIVLGAAVIDDVLGLIILAVVAGIVSTGAVSVTGMAVMSLKALGFLVGAVVIGQALSPRLGKLLSALHPGVGMKMALALLFCGVFSYGASALAGLAPIVGAFAAGLVLDPVHFNAFRAPEIVGKLRGWAARSSEPELKAEMTETAHDEEHGHVENLIDGVSHFFVPIFFVYTGLQVDLAAFLNFEVLGTALALTLVAIAGKFLCGYAAGPGTDKALVGFGMVPRGEVGLIFANVGKQLGVVNDAVFTVIVIMVILTTLLTPPILGALIVRKRPATAAA